ncbi:MAG TPA: phosphate uptake regulator PhoU [Conexivisphaerales archaeon]|nr:phosphate uptake regulator PhoU [Conexivisphaerales archaeon]
MTRLIDPGLERLKGILRDMAILSEKSVETSIKAYTLNERVTEEIYGWSEQINILHRQASDLAVDLIARYQPLASDLRYIESCFEISYGFSRLGRYAYDVAQLLDAFGDLSECNSEEVAKMGDLVKKMIHDGVEAFFEQDVNVAKSLGEMDDEVDRRYREHIKRIASRSAANRKADPRCTVAVTLAIRYLERMADHACYIGDSVLYVATGSKVELR